MKTTILYLDKIENSNNPIIHFMGITIKEVLDKPSIHELSREFGGVKIYSISDKIIRESLKLIDTKRLFKEEDSIAIFVNELFEVMEFETLEDIFLLFKMGRLGKYSYKYDKFDSGVIMREWLPEYLNMKAIEREKQHNSFKETLKKNPINDELMYVKTIISKYSTEYLDKYISSLKEDESNNIKYSNCTLLDLLKKERINRTMLLIEKSSAMKEKVHTAKRINYI